MSQSFFGFLLVLLMASSVAMAAPKKDTKTTKGKAKKVESVDRSHWKIQFQASMDAMAFDTKDAGITFTGTGAGLEGSVAYAFDDNLAVGVMTGVHGVDVEDLSDATGGFLGGGAWTYTPVEAFLQYNLDGRTGPYLLFGMGIAVNALTVEGPDLEDLIGPGNPDLSNVGLGLSNSALILSPGVGCSFAVADDLNIFFQTRLDINFLNEDFKRIFELMSPSGTGIGDGIFIPFQVGINFNTK